VDEEERLPERVARPRVLDDEGEEERVVLPRGEPGRLSSDGRTVA
jgi:hypothetical protein